MFDERDRTWLDRAASVGAPQVEILFRICDSFYEGDPFDAAQVSDPGFRVPLPPLAIGQEVKAWYPSAELIGHEEALANHYRSIVERATRLGRPFDHYREHFWVQLQIRWDGGYLSFPWYDTFADSDGFLGWLFATGDDQPWWDIDQGWEMAAIRTDDCLYVREGDGEGNERLVVRMDRALLLDRIREVRERAVTIVARLSAYLGADVWTRAGYGQKVVFGTADWRPGGVPPPAGWFLRS